MWDEEECTGGGWPLGLAPVAYGAWSGLGRSVTIEQFATAWFSGGGVPRARLRNAEKKIDGKQATIVKEAWKASIATGEPFVHGNDWEYDLIQANQSDSTWLEAQNASILDVARFFGCPGDLIDAVIHGAAKITYANV